MRSGGAVPLKMRFLRLCSALSYKENDASLFLALCRFARARGAKTEKSVSMRDTYFEIIPHIETIPQLLRDSSLYEGGALVCKELSYL